MEYYLSLTDAMAGTGALADAAGAKVAVGADVAGMRHVVLLDDVSESGNVNVNQSMVLVLGGKVLTLTGGCVNFGAGTVCTVDGTVPGSRILRSGSGAAAGIVVASGEKLTVKGGDYDALGSFTGSITAVKVTAGKVVMEDANVSSENTCTDNHYLYSRAVQCNPGTDAVIRGGRLAAQGQDQTNALVIGGKAKMEGVELEAVATSNGELYTPAATVMAIGTAELEMKDCEVRCGTQSIDGYGVFNNGADVKLMYCNVTVESQSGFVWGVNTTGTMHMEDCTVTINSQSGAVCGVDTAGTAHMKHCNVTGDSVSGGANGVYVAAGSQLRMDMCNVSGHTASAVVGSGGMNNHGTAIVMNSTAIADSAHGKKGTGVSNYGVCYLLNTDVTGNHSGCQNAGHLYVQGGTFTGWTHGGIYFAPGDHPETENGETGAGYLNYVSDAHIRCGYSGQHSEEIKASAAKFGACVYVGSGSEISVYMDNCVIGGTPVTNFDLEQYKADIEAEIAADPDCGLEVPMINPHAIAFRRFLGERNNILRISNSTVLDDTGNIRIDNADDGSDLGHRLYVGCGTNITVDRVNNRADTIFVPEENYRQNMAWFQAQVQAD